MKPQPITKQYSLHSVPLKTFLDPLHELVLLAMILNWQALEARYGAQFKPGRGAPPLATRLMIALHLLKYLYDESDESVVARVTENPYWQHFCGFVEGALLVSYCEFRIFFIIHKLNAQYLM